MRKWQPTPVFLSEKPHGQSLAGYSPCGSKEEDTTQHRAQGTWYLKKQWAYEHREIHRKNIIRYPSYAVSRQKKKATTQEPKIVGKPPETRKDFLHRFQKYHGSADTVDFGFIASRIVRQ